MAYDSTVPDHYTIDFATSAKLRRDRTNKVISQYCHQETNCFGERKTFNIDNFVEGRETTGQRFPKLNVQEPLGEIRSVTPRDFELTLGRDKRDGKKLYPLITGNGSHVKNHDRYYKRTCDEVFREGIRGTNYVGPTGTTATEIDSANIIAVNFVNSGSPAASNLTWDKILEVQHLARKAELIGKDTAYEDGKLHCALNSDMMRALVQDVYDSSNKDYEMVRSLQRGEINEANDVVFHRTEDVPTTTDADIFEALFWVPELTAMAVWDEFTYHAWLETSLGHAPLTSSDFQMNACRLQDNAVFAVACNTTL